MNMFRRGPLLAGCGLGVLLMTSTCCQTWFAGMTLPSGWYLQHPPQYIPDSPATQFSHETASQEAAAAQAVGAVPPAPVVPAPVPVPAAPGP